MTSYDEWVEVEQDSEWVFINRRGNEETRPDDSTDEAAASYEHVGEEESDVDGDGNDDQNQDRETFKDKDVDGAAHVFSAHDERAFRFFHGACKIVTENGAHPERVVSYYRSAHGFCQAEACEDDDKGAHVFFYESLFSEGSCEVDAERNANEHFDVKTAHAFSEDACDDDDDIEEEENDEYSDLLHEGALQDEANGRRTSLMDAIDRYRTNPLKECWHEYICSVQTETRRELHEMKMASFRGYGPEPRPFIDGSTCFNPLFEQMWLPWAVKTEYCHDDDGGLLVWDGPTGYMQCKHAAKQYMSSAVPILPVLEYMVNRTPRSKIAHIGSCSSVYWAALLQQLGASNVIVTEGACSAPVFFTQVKQIDEETFFKLGMAVEQALFFLRPSKRSRDAEMTERCLFCFPGDTFFFVGECGKHADHFDMEQWVKEHAHEGWHVEKQMEIPCWPGSHDVFLCISKARMPANIG